jgi:hypothetical protein
MSWRGAKVISKEAGGQADDMMLMLIVIGLEMVGLEGLDIWRDWMNSW